MKKTDNSKTPTAALRPVGGFHLANHPCQPEDMVLTWTYRSVKITVTEESDGLITKNSAMALPGVQGNCIIRADGVNHEELKNHAEMFRIFNDIFSQNGVIYDQRNPDFFHVAPR